MVSYNEQVEAENIRQNYVKYGVQYVSYELMLPPRMPYFKSHIIKLTSNLKGVSSRSSVI